MAAVEVVALVQLVAQLQARSQPRVLAPFVALAGHVARRGAVDVDRGVHRELATLVHPYGVMRVVEDAVVATLDRRERAAQRAAELGMRDVGAEEVDRVPATPPHAGQGRAGLVAGGGALAGTGAAAPRRGGGAEELVEPRAYGRRGDREVTVLLATGEVQGDGLAGVEVDNGRARVAAERGAVVRDELLLVADLGDLAGREPLDVVDVPKMRSMSSGCGCGCPWRDSR